MIAKTVKENGLLLLILSLALFLRVYKMPSLMAFGGDVARDYLVARDITLKGKVPLIGSPTSVPWLYQGAFFTYLLGVILFIGKFNPLAGGYFVAIAGTVSVLGLYLLGKRLFNKEAGLVSAFFYALSPLIVVFDRYPYHQSLISIFTIAFIYSLFLASQKPKYFVLAFFLFGLLMQLELSNLVIFPILFIWLFLHRKNVSFKSILTAVLFFVLTWLPKIIYDLKNSFSQTIGFLLWVLHKLPIVRQIIGDREVGLPLIDRFRAIFLYLSRIIYWPSVLLSTLIFTLFLLICLKKRLNLLVLLWVFVPIFGFLIMGSPSESYVPVLFGGIALLIGNAFLVLKNKSVKVLVFTGVFIIGIENCFILINHNFFMTTSFKNESYNHGFSYALNQKIANELVSFAKGKKFNLIALGNYGNYNSSLLNTQYLCWYFGNEPSEEKQDLKYYLYEKKDNISVKNAVFIKDFNYIMVAGVEKK